MTTRKTWLILLMVALMALWGCSDDDDDNPTDPTPDYLTFEEVAALGATYVNGDDCPGVIPAATVAANLAGYTIIDIRSADSFAAGHIEGAYNSSFATLLDDLAGTIPGDKPYVVACYSGQSAGHAKIAMELAGYSPVFSLKWGMAGWNSSLSASWMNATVDDAAGGDNLMAASTVNENGNLTEHAFPDLPADFESDADVAAWILENGFQGKAWEDVNTTLDQYFIINYFTEDQYLGQGDYAYLPGHIEGAYQFTPKASLAVDQMLDNIDPDLPVLVYCWTSQTSSQITAYLNLLGYEAYSLKFGVNHLFYSSLPDGSGAKWAELTTDYPLVTE